MANQRILLRLLRDHSVPTQALAAEATCKPTLGELVSVETSSSFLHEVV